MMRTVFMVFEKEDKNTAELLPRIKCLFVNHKHAHTFAEELQKYAPPGTEFVTVPLIVKE